MMEMIFNRFRLETGQPSASQNQLGLIGQESNSKEIQNVPLVSATVSNSLIYKNPEIIDNIHFYPPTSTNENDKDIDGNGDWWQR